MLTCLHNGIALFVTHFNDKYNLVQKFRGLEQKSSLRANCPVDFMESGLMQKDKWDCWHVDVPFAICTDEATPCFVNGSYIGANHGAVGAVAVLVENHGLTYKYVGTVWQDQSGMEFTLMRVENQDWLLFLSNNVGKSQTKYAFINKIDTLLTQTETNQTLVPEKQTPAELLRVIRHTQKTLYAVKDGKRSIVRSSAECDYAQIHEHYQIINPSTIATQLRKTRKEKGFCQEQDLADYGSPMIDCKLIYTINSDGTIFTEFDYKLLQKVDFTDFQGVMFQEKLDVFGGGIYRYLPKILPFETIEGRFDFSKPYPIQNAPYPKDVHLRREDFSDNGNPCERCVDYFKDKNGVDKLGFACGFLPIFDGQPQIRDKRVIYPWHAKFTRKFYPTFCDGDITDFKGVGYKKYFIPTANNGGYYTVDYQGERYIYIDLFLDQTVSINLPKNPTLLEKGKGIEYQYRDGVLNATKTGDNAFAVFKITID